ncbi:MAG: helix-turn-helix domain-containing protein [Desertifilum sp. SIO1I2]|nr:helix-turn-helix domain-containing protein [Desertifilum sp. SIO1I2]
MQHQAVKVRLYPTSEQQKILYQHFGCARWWWNYALKKKTTKISKEGERKSVKR